MENLSSIKNMGSGLFRWLKSNKEKSFLILFLIAVGLITLLFFREVHLIEINSSEPIKFEIKQGEGVQDVANKLEKRGVTSSSFSFITYSFLTGNHKNLQAGEYELENNLTIADLIDKFSRGDTTTYQVTVVEGWTLKNVADRLEKIGLKDSERFFDLAGLSKPQANLLGLEEKYAEFSNNCPVFADKPKEASLEGYIYPDTYEVSNNNLKNFLRLATNNLCNKITEDHIREAKDKGLSTHELITFASLLEREVPTKEERRKVADVLWRRKEAGIPLQVDMTVNYVTGRRDINVTLEETEVDSSYNTYEVKGLPKGPIGNPSIESIEAVLNPKENSYWYYLSDPETRETIFSQNHLEHIRAKNRYLNN